jgi:hypothetical protein
LDPKEQHSYLTRKLAYIDAFTGSIARHLGTLRKYPAKRVLAMGA